MWCEKKIRIYTSKRNGLLASFNYIQSFCMDFYTYELPRPHRKMDMLVENDDSLNICKYCKADLINESKFCTNCGTSVIEGEKINHIPDDFGFHSTMAKVYFYTLVTNIIIILSVIFISKYLPNIQWIIKDHLLLHFELTTNISGVLIHYRINNLLNAFGATNDEAWVQNNYMYQKLGRMIQFGVTWNFIN